MSYDHHFYDDINNGSVQSAKAVVPVLMELFDPTTVVDWGCGEGAWLSVFKEKGCKVSGFDGEYIDKQRLLIDESEFSAGDLSGEISPIDTYDLAISLEVAEHLPASSSEAFVTNICSSSDIILFSAAIPGQGGVGHVNEQWPSYWIEMFESRAYFESNYLRNMFWENVYVENWYKQNMIIFIHDRLYGEFSWLHSRVLNAVHPENWYDHHLGGKYNA